MKILLTTLHAKYSHASLALPCLAAFCADLPDLHIVIREWTVNEPRDQILRRIMAERADLVAFSCYIWNIEHTLRLADDIKRIAPTTRIVLGGPEASYGVFELMHGNPALDFVIRGEGETAFRRLLATLRELDGAAQEDDLFQEHGNLFYRHGADILSGPLGDGYVGLDTIPSPFGAGLVDTAKPLIYYETSRGCPFSCAFCLSSLEGAVRSFPPERIERDLAWLMEREIGQIKLVDRTFNYNAERANRIWEFILHHNRASHFHFEIAADLLTDANLALLKMVPSHTFGFEIGVQSVSAETLEQVQRKADLTRLEENVRRLRNETRVELHLDLLAGLPGEDYQGLLASLERVAALKPHMIQIEPLKVLKGSPMRTIAARHGYQFSQAPPYMILGTPWLSYDDIVRIEIVARLLDLFYNSGNFGCTLRLLGERIGVAELFHRMALNSGDENLSGLGTLRAFELFATLAAPLLPERERPQLYDALFYDYCRTEMPLRGKLPKFATQHREFCAWPGGRSEQSPGERIKVFRCRFGRDYRIPGWPEGGIDITFQYSSAPGRGLRVRVLDE